MKIKIFSLALSLLFLLINQVFSMDIPMSEGYIFSNHGVPRQLANYILSFSEIKERLKYRSLNKQTQKMMDSEAEISKQEFLRRRSRYPLLTGRSIYVKWLAKLGHGEAMRALGHMYLSGLGIGHDPEKAVHWLKSAANKGDDLAKFDLAKIYFRGEGVKRNLREVWRLCDEIEKGDSPEALTELANAHVQGSIVAEDKEKALELYERCINKKYGKAAYDLASFYQTTKLGAIDLKKAEVFAKLAIEWGCTQGYMHLIFLHPDELDLHKSYMKAIDDEKTLVLLYLGLVIEGDHLIDIQKGIKCFKSALENECHNICGLLAEFLFDKRPIIADWAQDPSLESLKKEYSQEVVNLLRKSAWGSIGHHARFGDYYLEDPEEHFMSGVEPNYEEGIRIFWQLANEGYMYALNVLAYVYEVDLYGVQDPRLSMELSSKRKFLEALYKKPNDPTVLKQAAWMYLNLKRLHAEHETGARRAIPLLKRLVETGTDDGYGCFQLARIYLTGEEDLGKNPKEAQRYLEKLDQIVKTDIFDKKLLGYIACLYLGETPNLPEFKDYKKAFSFLKILNEQGGRKEREFACHRLAKIFIHPVEGFEQNIQEAKNYMALLDEIVEPGIFLTELLSMYWGENGYEEVKDEQKAEELLRRFVGQEN